MKPSATVAVAILMLVLVAGFQAQSSFSTGGQRSTDQQLLEHRPEYARRATPAVHEPTGYTAACFASNLDTRSQILVAEIFDWRGNNVTETSSCGVSQGPGVTCQS